MANPPETSSQPGLRPAVFLDRDGVLNEDLGYSFDVAQLRVIAGAALALKQLKDRGYLLIVVSNQSGVARGYFTTTEVDRFNAALNQRLRMERGTGVDAFYYCPFHPDGKVPGYTKASPLRKPEPGMVLQAAAEHGVDLRCSYLVGDKFSDVECAIRAGVKGIQVAAPGQSKHPLALFSVSSLADVPALIPVP